MTKLLQQCLDALEPFVKDAARIDPRWSNDRRRNSLTQDKPLTVGHFREAQKACAAIEQALAQQEQPASVDAYNGAREDAAIWKKRALEAEELNRKFIAELNGPAYLGEPVKQEQPAQEPVTRPEPFKMEIPPPPADMLEVVFAEGWNTCCDEFFGGKAPQEPVVITVTTPAPTQPALSDGEIYEIVSNAADELWSGISRVAPWTSEDAEFYEAIVRKVEAHCRGGK